MHIDVAPYIDHTLLKPDTTAADVERLCKEAIQYGFAAVCVPPCYVKEAAALLHGTSVKTATVISFPLGYSTTATKLREIESVITEGADELDMVHNIALFKTGRHSYLEQEATACAALAHSAGKKLKLIIETGLMSDEEIETCCRLYAHTPIDFLKTSTGFSGGGGTVHAVELIRKNLPGRIAIKASGGIRTLAQAKALIEAGASRLGCSAGVQIINEKA